MRNIFGKIATGIKVIRLFRNWPSVILSYFGLLEDAQLVFTLHNGIKYIVASSNDWPTIFEIWSGRIYTPLGDEIKSGYTVVDIGAHVGVFSIFAASHSDSVRVVSYEPHPDNFQLLTENIKLNNLKNIEPLQLAVSGASGKRKLFISRQDVGHSLVKPQKSYVEVDCVTLNEVLSQIGKCDFLKMDCEGAEYDILFNTSAECLNKVSKISVECHDSADFVPRHNNYNAYDLKTYLEHIGFKVMLDELKYSPHVYLHGRK